MDSAQLKQRIKRDDIQWQIGWLEGYELAFNKKASDDESGYANITAQEGQIVYGVLYKLTEQELDRLDQHEGAPTASKRMPVMVRTAGRPEAKTRLS